jgi:3-deoxy-manno-octulosonate cytidylyltransferase (CMP-KDO synthetase)
VHPQGTDARAGIVGAIPARYGSTRLAAKPLHPIAGKPMIAHVYERAAAARGLDSVVVLTDDERIVAAVESFGGRAEMTPEECKSGTDRIAWAARRWNARAVINIQGDEPLMDPEGISRVAAHLADVPGDAIVTLAADALEGDLENPNTVKVVLDRRGYALYFSRAAIPYPRLAGAAPVLRHLGIYGYQADALQRLAQLEPTPLERSESLEQLRALENGIAIRVLTGARPSQGVDTAEDVERVEDILRQSAIVPSL